MGTATDWIWVFLAGAAYGGGMLFIGVRNRKMDNLQPVVFLALVVMWGATGLCFGIVTTFHFSRAFHWPLVLVTLGAFGAMAATAFYVHTKYAGVRRTTT